ncbi:MAG: hypothetical protein QXU32_11870 [Nitrososphaerales archaeon]
MKLNHQKDKPVRLYAINHKALKRISFQCEIALEALVNSMIAKVLNDKEFLEEILRELEVEPRCMDEL